MIVGIVGNIKGITEEQADAFLKLMVRYRQKYGRLIFHHGGCRGADETIHAIIMENTLAESIELHPSSDKDHQPEAPLTERDGGGIKIPLTRRRERPHMGRFHDIIDTCQLIIVLPGEAKEIKDSDVWAAYRYAKTKKKTIITILPDGRATKWPVVKAAGSG